MIARGLALLPVSVFISFKRAAVSDTVFNKGIVLTL